MEYIVKIILPNQVAHYVEERIRAKYPQSQIVHTDPDGNPLGDVSDATILVRWWYGQAEFMKLVRAAPQLQWVYTPSAGIEYMDLQYMRDNGIVLTNAAGVHAIPIAEFIMMFVLNHAKRASVLANFARDAWEEVERIKLDELHAKTMAIIGLGGIGQETAKRAKAFGMRVVGSRRRPQVTSFVDEVVADDAWQTLLPDADYVVLSTPLTDRTRGMFDARAFAMMKPTAYLINVARGNVINTDDLITALHTKQIAGAGLDVQPEEPLPVAHPLWDAPNVWITPHVSSSSPKSRARLMELFADNLDRFVHQQPLLSVVNYHEGY